MEEEKDWLFTFGYNQEHEGKFVRIFGTYNSARAKMFEAYGTKWSMQYPAEDEQMLKRSFFQELKF